MPPKRQFKRKTGKRRGFSGSLSDNSLDKFVTTMRFRGIPFYVDQASSGTGGFTSANSGLTLTASNTVNIDPFNLGARISNVAADFQEYMIQKIRFKFCPANASSGADETVAGATTTPGYSMRTFAWGVLTDPGLGTSFLNGVEAGFKIGRTTSPSTIMVNTPHLHQWRFISTVAAGAAPPTTIDYRMVAPVKLGFYFSDTSTTTTARYGFIQYDAIVKFRAPANNAVPIGSSIQKSIPRHINTNPFAILDDMKDDDEKSVTLTRSLTEDEWQLVLSKRKK